MMQMRIILNASVSTVKRLRIGLGTFVAIEATAGSVSAAEAAVEAAFAAIAQVERLMHPQAAGSDLAKINSAPLHVRVPVHASICELLNLARRINTLTNGVFDPCLPVQPGRLRDIEFSSRGGGSTWGGGPTGGGSGPTSDGDPTGGGSGPTGDVVCHAPVALDFGGFAKGYAVDRAVETLISSGCTAGLVNAGGDLRVFGPRTEPMFLRGQAGELTNIELTDTALAVSDANSRQRPPEHQGYYGTPSLASDYAAVIAKDAVIADALAKCVLLCPTAVADRALQSFDATCLTAPHEHSTPHGRLPLTHS
jgi:thiamine biosynthesis lipoprotein